MKIFALVLMILAVLCMLAGFVLHFGTSKYERMNAGRLRMDPKKKRRISLGYWCYGGFVVLIAAGGILFGMYGG